VVSDLLLRSHLYSKVNIQLGRPVKRYMRMNVRTECVHCIAYFFKNYERSVGRNFCGNIWQT